ncbi:MAG: folate family ECF transporter S component [Lachnospiraceae bacterium]|nr:folate family ECF transporter S component [Lachnospiraceae bacterium]
MEKTASENKKSIFVNSIRELKNVRAVTFCGMMAALAIALNYVASIDIGPYVRIGFSGIPNQIVAYVFGPAVGAIFGALLDIIKFIIKPSGMFFPGFTISAALGGLIYGLFLYRKPVSVKNVLIAQILIKIFVNIGLNTLWLKLLYDKAILVILPGRILSNAVMLPIDTILMLAVLSAVERFILPYFRNHKDQ